MDEQNVNIVTSEVPQRDQSVHTAQNENSNHAKKESRKNLFQFLVATLLVVPAILFWSGLLMSVFVAFMFFSSESEMCTVARIPLQGILTATDNGIAELLGMGVITSADSVINKINAAENDKEITAILLDVDSPGGTPVAGDEIMQALLGTQKPTVAVIRDRGTSAAYWASAGADYIIASPVSDVGSVGVTMSYLEYASSSDMDGSRWIDISSGLFKDAGNPERVLREEEELYFQSQVDMVHEYMVNQISSARKTVSREELFQLADGRAYLGTKAVELHLIDAIGGLREAKTYLAERLLVSKEDVVLCDSYGLGIESLLK